MTMGSAALLQQSVRANVINELVTAERDYVKLLSDLVDVRLCYCYSFIFFQISTIYYLIVTRVI